MTYPSVPDHIPSAVLRDEAATLMDDDQYQAAAALLAPLLAHLDPTTCDPDIELIDTAVLYAAAVDDDESGTHLHWATYAYQAARTLCGPRHERTLGAAEVLAELLHIAREYARAVPLWRHVHQSCTALEGPDAYGTVYAAMWLVRCLHDAGDCDQALTELDRLSTILSTRRRATDQQALQARYYRYVLLERCGRLDEAQQCRDTVTAHLPPAHTPERGSLHVAFEVLRQQHTDESHASLCAHQQPPTCHDRRPLERRHAGHAHRNAAPPGRPPAAHRRP